MERFACKTAVVSGEDALSVLSEYAPGQLLLVTESRLLRDGLVRRICRAAGSPKTEYLESGGGMATMLQAVNASRVLQSLEPDLVVALGGQEVLDWGKAMVCFSRRGCPLAVIPTAFGPGTEVTGQVILTHNGRCHLLRDEAMAPTAAILGQVPDVRLPRQEMGEGGFALLSAALEAYSICGSPLGEVHAREAFVSAWAALPGAYGGSAAGAERMETASILAGMACDGNPLGLCRAMENSLAVVFGLTRGTAAGILLPVILGCNAHAAGSRYAELSRAAGLGGSSRELGLRNLKNGLCRLRRELGLPATLTQAGVDLRRIRSSGSRIVELTLEDPACRNNPVAVDDFVVRRILEEITGRM